MNGDYEGFKIPEPGSGAYHDWSRPAVLLPLLPGEDWRPRVLFCGDTTAIRIDLARSQSDVAEQPRSRHGGERTAGVQQRRAAADRTGLPSGWRQRGRTGEPVLQAEIYDPGIDWAADAYTAPDSWDVEGVGPAHPQLPLGRAAAPNGKGGWQAATRRPHGRSG